ncbi:MAG: hypothetical protein JSU94_20850 [Phycisphaerales bacterium]|nr:MAG: hypothetical protein JSU94_20850 [Phycisphaerales bacterium]
MTAASKRAEQLAWVSLVLCVLFFGVAFFIGRWSAFFAVSALSWLALPAALIWFALAVQFHQRALAEREKLDISQLARDRQTSAIFQAKGEGAALLAAAQRRVRILEKWFIPIFSGLIAACQIALGLYLLKSVVPAQDVQTKQPLVCAVSMITVAFVSFVISRYATGMSAEPAWKPLRAGGSFLLAIALTCFALAVGLALAQFQFFHVVNAISYVVPVMLIVLGAETAFNVVLDIYRPRLKGQYSRAAFDSRLLGIINEPGGIFRSAASAIDYQFGFKVSQTWFYRLLERAIVPLVLFGALTLYLMSCFVVVGPNEEAIIEHFGNPLDAEGKTRLAGPGLTLKWPWPIDIAYKHPTKRVTEIYVGYVPKTDPDTGRIIHEKELLWGQSHYEEEYPLIVASPYTGQAADEGGVPVSVVNANIPVQYRIKDLYSFVYGHSNPKERLEAICYNELAKFGAGATIEVDTEQDLRNSLLGAGTDMAKEVLTQNIQKAADDAGLGVEIVFLGLQGIHPPVAVAADYQEVMGAVQEKQSYILKAQTERNTILTSLVGSVRDANALYALAARYQKAEAENRPEDVNRLGTELDAAFRAAAGEIFKKLREAESYAVQKVTDAKAAGQRFVGQLQAYRAAPEIYLEDQRLEVMEQTYKGIRKFVLVDDPNDEQVIIFDVAETVQPDIYKMGIPGVEKRSSEQ